MVDKRVMKHRFGDFKNLLNELNYIFESDEFKAVMSQCNTQHISIIDKIGRIYFSISYNTTIGDVLKESENRLEWCIVHLEDFNPTPSSWGPITLQYYKIHNLLTNYVF